jgi:cobalt/nickel transport protein
LGTSTFSPDCSVGIYCGFLRLVTRPTAQSGFKEEKIMKKSVFFLMPVLFVLGAHATAFAHFGMVIPSDSMIMQGDSKIVKLMLSFSHPFEIIGMDLVKPKVFAVTVDGKTWDLLDTLRKTKVMNHTAWEADFRIKRPGVYIFHMEPEPYWEPAEDCFIVHYTKAVAAAFGDDEGWDTEMGLMTEIVPLSRPFGLYAGNVFQGIVKLHGKPVAHAKVEVEYYNRDKRSEAPTDYMLTQAIKADENGVFTYAAPRAGWWGFAALNTADKKMIHNGEEKDVEVGAVIWVKFHEWRVR